MKGFAYWYGASVYAFLWFCFFFGSSIYSVSVSLGIIRFLFEQPGKNASLKEIYDHCIQVPFQERANFLVATKQTKLIDGFYSITPAGKLTVKRLRLVHMILGMESHGFYSAAPEGIEIGLPGGSNH